MLTSLQVQKLQPDRAASASSHLRRLNPSSTRSRLSRNFRSSIVRITRRSLARVSLDCCLAEDWRRLFGIYGRPSATTTVTLNLTVRDVFHVLVHVS